MYVLSFVLSLITATLSCTLAFAADIQVSVSPGEGSTRTIFKVVVRISAPSVPTFNQPELKPTENFTLQAVVPQRSISIINFDKSEAHSFTFVLAPRKDLPAGVYKIEFQPFEFQGERIALPDQEISITDTPAASSREDGIAAYQRLSEVEAYIGQQVVYSAEIRSSFSIQGQAWADLEANDYWWEPLGEQNLSFRGLGNSRELLITSRLALFPRKVGQLQIVPRRVELSIVTQNPTFNSLGGIFSDPILSGHGAPFGVFNTEQKELVAAGLKLSVLPLPPPPADIGKMPSYIPVGSLDVRSIVDKQETKQGEGVTLTIIMLGNANLRPFTLDPLQSTGPFKVYADEPALEVFQDRAQLTHKKTFKVSFVSRKAGKFPLPRYKIIWFDPTTKLYRSTETAAEEISVIPDPNIQTIDSGDKQGDSQSKRSPLPQQTATDRSSQESNQDSNQDSTEERNTLQPLRPLRGSGVVVPEISRGGYLGVLGLFSLAWLFLLLFQTPRQVKVSNLPELKKLTLKFKGADASEALTLLSPLKLKLGIYLAEYYRLPKTVHSFSDILEKADGELKTAIQTLHKDTQSVLFAGKELSSTEQAAIAQLVEKIISLTAGSAEQLIKVLIFGVFFTASSLLALTAKAEDASPKSSHTADGPAIENTHAENTTLDLTERVAAGDRSPTVLYNLGTIYLQQGNPSQALLYLKRALILDPRSEDVRVNLTIASSRLGQDQSSTNSKLREGNAFILSIAETRLLCLAAYLILFSVAMKAIQKRHRVASFLALLLSVVVAVTGYVYQIDGAGNPSLQAPQALAIVTGNGDSYFFAGPNEQDQVVEVLKEGTEIEVISAAESWLFATLPSGKKGWIKSDRISLL